MQKIVQKIPNWAIISLIVLSAIGFFDSTYLAAEHYLGGVPPCILGGGCEEVTTSRYSIVLGIPVALFGAIYYLAMFLLGVRLLETKEGAYLRWISNLSSLGLLATLYFVSLQLFVIKAICTYCMLSAITTSFIFVISFYYRRVLTKNDEQ